MTILSPSSVAQPFFMVDGATGDAVNNTTNTQNVTTTTAALPPGTDRSGTAGTSASVLAPALATRKGLEIQNISANVLGVNEIGGTAAIGTAGTYTLAAGASMRVRTSRAISVIASVAASAYTATEY